jgi:hypothetical protein
VTTVVVVASEGNVTDRLTGNNNNNNNNNKNNNKTCAFISSSRRRFARKPDDARTMQRLRAIAKGASVPLSATRPAVGEGEGGGHAGVEMVSLLSRDASASERAAYELGAQVADVEAKDQEEDEAAQRAEEDARDDEVTDAQREAFAAGHAVASEAFPELLEEEGHQ